MGEQGHNGKGERGVEHQLVETVVLTYNRATDHLDVAGKFNSIDLALDMMARATRALEKEKRIQDALELQQRMQAAARTQAVLDGMKNRGRGTMGVRFPSVPSTTIVASPGGSTETVICTTPPLNISLDFAQDILLWYLMITAGTGTISLVPLLRRCT